MGSLVTGDRMACIAKGTLWKDIGIERYQTLIKGKQKDRLIRYLHLREMGQEWNIWKGI